MNLAGRKVLLVEDEIIVGFMLEDMIVEQGADATLVSSRASAEKVLGEQGFDLAVIDVNLNGEDSYPVADMLRARNCPFIFATGYGSVTHPERYSGIPTVTKPYAIDAILNALSDAPEALKAI